MSRRDGTGPMGMGAMTGRGMGLCNLAKVVGAIGGLGLGLGLGRRRGARRNGFNTTINPENQKDLLKEQKSILENRLNVLNHQLNTLEDDK